MVLVVVVAGVVDGECAHDKMPSGNTPPPKTGTIKIKKSNADILGF